MTTICASCAEKSLFTSTCGKCKKASLCGNCCNYALIDTQHAVVSCCRECFRSGVRLDLTRDVEIVGPVQGEAVTVVLVHGGGGCRAMYRLLAARLSDAGYRCVLPDLPGHGGRMDEPTTLDNCIASLKEVFDKYAAPYKGVNPIFLGGSFGGYVGMEFLARYPTVCSAAVLCCCAQNVGNGAGFAARAALGVMKFMTKYVISAATTVKMMNAAVKNAPNVDHDIVQKLCIETGWYFHQGEAQTATLRCTDSIAALNKFNGPVLFLNGSKDHRDMLDVLFANCQNKSTKALSKSVLYENGDHFFSHDKRFREQFETDVYEFCERVVASLSTAAAVPLPQTGPPQE